MGNVKSNQTVGINQWDRDRPKFDSTLTEKSDWLIPSEVGLGGENLRSIGGEDLELFLIRS